MPKMITSGLPRVKGPTPAVPPNLRRYGRIVAHIAAWWIAVAAAAWLFTAAADRIVPHTPAQWLLELALRLLAVVPGLVALPYGITRLTRALAKH